MKRFPFLIFIFSILILLSFNADNELLEKIAGKLERYYEEFPEEKAFIQTDKPYYVAGESVWYKTYLVEAISNMPDSVSVPLYVELTDPVSGFLITRQIIKLDGGIGYGDLELPANIKPGIYPLRAYTAWMRNFKDELFFSKNIQVLSSSNTQPAQKINEDDIDMQFFPEGGDLIEGLDARVAFKAIDAGGNGVDLTGKLISSSGDTVARFKSDHIGMGTFKFKPQANKTYKTIIQFRNIYSRSFDLPLSKKEGMSMTVDNISSKAQIRISLNNNLANTGMLVIGQSRGIIFYASKVNAGTPNAFITVPKEKFPAGVAQFTIFDESLKPRCERIIFIPDTRSLNINLSINKTEYSTREKTTVQIEVKDHESKPVRGHFLISVLDETQIKDFSNIESIQSYLLLNSDIKGYIENPIYYFDKSNKYAAMHLDILLMSQGWRRFNWDQIFQDQLPQPKHLIEKGLIVSGSVLRPNGKIFEKPQNITLMIGRDTNQQFLMNTTNTDGTFLFYGLDFKDSVNIMAQIMKTDNTLKASVKLHDQNFALLEIDKDFKQVLNVDYDKFSEYILNTKKSIDYENQLKLNDAIWLSEMTVVAKKKVKAPEGPRVLYSNADDVIKGTASPSALNIFDLIRGKVAGLQINDDRSDPNVTIRGKTSITLDGGPLYLVDGVPVSKQTVLALDINSVDRVEVVKSLAGGVMYGDQANGGIISVFLKSGADIPTSQSDAESRGNTTAAFQGYYTQKQFYSPKYASSNPSSVPDLRTTVYWNPIIKTNAEGKAQVEYYNSDAQSNIRIYVEGISGYGHLGVSQVNYLVKK